MFSRTFTNLQGTDYGFSLLNGASSHRNEGAASISLTRG